MNKDQAHIQERNNTLIISYLTLRRVIGLIGILLPATLITGTFLVGKCGQIQYSVSHYYYTMMGDVFVGAICAISLFLITYRGYKDEHWYHRDSIFTTIAGIAVLGVAFFPTSKNEDIECGKRIVEEQPWRETAHYVSAAIFFVMLAYISLVLFTRSDHKKRAYMPRKKKSRNNIYIGCGITILVAICLIFFLGRAKGDTEQWVTANHIVFWLEWVGLAAFGTSWLVKGELILKDNE
ncbi:DUF998 domain-containing protein [Nemorincola caseinilytica]|uniref:DUF998 domain-containing protein n=1 Tax=Nemorincola caseinilytica TaxID=2054315 RepID=A0ABP8NPS3_9BACT